MARQVNGKIGPRTQGAEGKHLRRLMEIVTPLGGDVLVFHRMHAREDMSRLFE